jgi:hypothetical protein
MSETPKPICPTGPKLNAIRHASFAEGAG